MHREVHQNGDYIFWSEQSVWASGANLGMGSRQKKKKKKFFVFGGNAPQFITLVKTTLSCVISRVSKPSFPKSPSPTAQSVIT